VIEILLRSVALILLVMFVIPIVLRIWVGQVLEGWNDAMKKRKKEGKTDGETDKK